MSNRKRMVTPDMLRKQASPPPAMPGNGTTEGFDHPASYEDPDKDAYKSGDTSSWAEDVHQPPYPEGPPPAMPGNSTTEAPDHPAEEDDDPVAAPTGPMTAQEADARAPKQAALSKQAVFERAGFCVRLAQAALPNGTEAQIENKALQLMDDMDNNPEKVAYLAETLDIKEAAKKGEDEDQDEASDDDDDAKMGGKKASDFDARIARLEEGMNKLVTAFEGFFAMDDEHEAAAPMSMEEKAAAYDSMMMEQDMDMDGVDQNADDYGYDMMAEDMSDDDAMAYLMAMDDFERGEESEGTKEWDEGKESMQHRSEEEEMEAMLMAMSDHDAQVDAPHTPQVEQHHHMATDAENDIDMTVASDVMGLGDAPTEPNVMDDALASLYSDMELGKTAKKADDDEDDDDDDDDDEEVEVEEEVEEEDDKEASKKASERRPQRRTASAGPKSLGNVVSTPGSRNEIEELAKIWDHAPDVSDAFK